MVLLAKWIPENNPPARVAIITDCDELDKQIERVFRDAGETSKRSSSGKDLMNQLGQATPRLLCSLVHKFGRKDVDNFDAFLKDLQAQPSKTAGEVFVLVFVDECHRTPSGKLHKVMKATMPNAVFVGFTGMPLLKKDKETSLEVFGGHIHTYKFSEGVEDGVRPGLLTEHLDVLLFSLPDSHAAEFGNLLLNRVFHVVFLSWSRQPRVHEGSTSREYQVEICRAPDNATGGSRRRECARWFGDPRVAQNRPVLVGTRWLTGDSANRLICSDLPDGPLDSDADFCECV